METTFIYEIIGYIASVLIAVSLMMSAIVKLRVINLIGAATFSLYGVLIGSVPVAAMNGFIVLINIYYLFQMFSEKEYFKLLQVRPESHYLRYFISFYEDDIKQTHPYFTFNPNEDSVCVFILRDMVPAGILIGKKTPDGLLEIELDYVIKNYRDFKIGSFLYEHNTEFFSSLGIRAIRMKSGEEVHNRYLSKMGFERADGYFTRVIN